MNITEKLQIKNSTVVISSASLAVLLGRKHLSVLRGIDAIPEHCLRESMFIMDRGELFLSADGICMLDMSKRHFIMRWKIMRSMDKFADAYKAKCWKAFYDAMPSLPVLKLITFFYKIKMDFVAYPIYRFHCWKVGYDPSKVANQG